MNEQALFCDGTGAYVIPPQPDANEVITLRFRTAKDDVDAVRLLTRDAKYDLQKVYTKGEFDFYEVNWRMGEDTFRYCFEIQKGEEICYYNRYGVTNEIIGYYAFSIAPGFATPDWAKGAVMYQIFVDRFYNGDTNNDVESGEYMYIGEPCTKVDDWD